MSIDNQLINIFDQLFNEDSQESSSFLVGYNTFLNNLSEAEKQKLLRILSDGLDDGLAFSIAIADTATAGIALGKGAEPVLSMVAQVILPISLIIMIASGYYGRKSSLAREKDLLVLKALYETNKEEALEDENSKKAAVEKETIFLLYTLACDCENIRKNDGTSLTDKEKKIVRANANKKLRRSLLLEFETNGTDSNEMLRYIENDITNQKFKRIFLGYIPMLAGSAGLLSLLGVGLALAIKGLFFVAASFTFFTAVSWMIPAVTLIATICMGYSAIAFWFKYAEAKRRLELVKNDVQRKINDIKSKLKDLDVKILNNNEGEQQLKQLQKERAVLQVKLNYYETKLDIYKEHVNERFNKAMWYTGACAFGFAATGFSLAFLLVPIVTGAAVLGILSGAAVVLIAVALIALTFYLVHNINQRSSLKDTQATLNDAEVNTKIDVLKFQKKPETTTQKSWKGFLPSWSSGSKKSETISSVTSPIPKLQNPNTSLD